MRRDIADPSIGEPESLLVGRVPDSYPPISHVVEPASPGAAAFEVSDELVQDPGLVRVGNSMTPMLDASLGQDEPPGKVSQRNGLPVFCLDRALIWRSRDLV